MANLVAPSPVEGFVRKEVGLLYVQGEGRGGGR
jgi:hypothetical protein